jgi:hypothetical protein
MGMPKCFYHNRLLLCTCALCALLTLSVSHARTEDYTTGTPGGAGKVIIDPESGDRKVEVRSPPPSGESRQQPPIYVYPEVRGPWRHPPPGRKSVPARPPK